MFDTIWKNEKEKKRKKEMAHTITNFFILDFINMNWTEEEEKKFAHIFRCINYLLKKTSFYFQ